MTKRRRESKMSGERGGVLAKRSGKKKKRGEKIGPFPVVDLSLRARRSASNSRFWHGPG